jgi:hypothetical protein
MIYKFCLEEIVVKINSMEGCNSRIKLRLQYIILGYSIAFLLYFHLIYI